MLSNAALVMLQGMSGQNGISLPAQLGSKLAFMGQWGIQFNGLIRSELKLSLNLGLKHITKLIYFKFVSLLAMVWLTPNTIQWLKN